jgi:hypothetical protein
MKGIIIASLLLSAVLASHVGKLRIEVPRTVLANQEEVNVTVWLDTGIPTPSSTLVNHPILVSFSSKHVGDIELYSHQCVFKSDYYECLTDREGRVQFTVIAGEDHGNATMHVRYEPTYTMDSQAVEFQVGDPHEPTFLERLIAGILKFLGF